MYENRIEFRFGAKDLALAFPPFFIDFKKHSLRSLVTHKMGESVDGVYVFAFYTKELSLKELAILKEIHPDISFLGDIEFTERAKEFKKAVEELEKSWPYYEKGIWLKKIENVKVYMILIVDEDRWTIRAAVTREGYKGYNVEIPVDTSKAEEFEKILKEGELEEIHDHLITQHFHLIIESLDRYISLVKDWDYYFSKNCLWPPLFEFKMIR